MYMINYIQQFNKKPLGKVSLAQDNDTHEKTQKNLKHRKSVLTQHFTN